ncbi:hypothetical protein AVEN_194527-1 [Araneus ventricosus]|uniref:Uncharacterized protein n=1 Tax=Araneus ventricosus TaxID=182803 RepID=A0A4Y2A6J8_ARAVE|nr:hypothetical protein AVEN_194527-1 [Araneus ventricosus]
MVHVKSYVVGQTFSRWCGTAIWRGWFDVKCRPRHLTTVQNYEVRPKIALLFLQNGTRGRGGLVSVKRTPAGMVRKFGEGVPDHKSFSSSDRDSKLRGPSQNSPRVASKRDVSATKQTVYYEIRDFPLVARAEK